MKILIVSPNDNTGGTERVASIYFRALTLNKKKVRICSIFKPLNSYGISPLIENSDCLHLAKRNKLLRPFILLFYLIRMRLKGYIILLQGEYAAAISFFLPFKVFIRITNNINAIRIDKSFLKIFFNFSLKRNYIIVPHKKLLNRNLINSNKVSILPNPIFKRNLNSQYMDNCIRDLLVSKKFKFISVGQLNYQKDHDFLLESIINLSLPEGFDYTLDIYGQGINEISLKKKIKELGLDEKINLLGWRDNPWENKKYIGHLLTSRSEGYPNVVLESANYSIPTIAVPIPPCTDDIILDNNIGLVSESRSSKIFGEFLTNYMNYLLKNHNYNFKFKSFIEKHDPLLLLDVINKNNV